MTITRRCLRSTVPAPAIELRFSVRFFADNDRNSVTIDLDEKPSCAQHTSFICHKHVSYPLPRSPRSHLCPGRTGIQGKQWVDAKTTPIMSESAVSLCQPSKAPSRVH
ncbi:hypothetical protein HGRIS_013631 [Hohenbuehelia grisea]|uniref:Uncharacterized protein n=1 Tax=Hohenbuehelia grisea TaxID=104357 RepID=A0ABR3IWD9_9AGAR